MTKTFYLNAPCNIQKFNEHDILKNELLKLIKEQNDKPLIRKNDYYGDNVTHYDWPKNEDFNRPWVKLFYPFFLNHVNNVAISLGFINIIPRAFWYQQYMKNDTHKWHVHGNNYTGVYYLELDKQSPTTELINPTNHTEIIKIDAEEGDIVIFPSFVKHRGPLITNDKRKTIISFNYDFERIDLELLKNV